MYYFYFLFTKVEFIYNFAEAPITHIQWGLQTTFGFHSVFSKWAQGFLNRES